MNKNNNINNKEDNIIKIENKEDLRSNNKNKKKEFSKIKNINIKKSNSLNKSQINKEVNSENIQDKKLKSGNLTVNSKEQKNYYNINYLNNNDFFHQNSNCSINSQGNIYDNSHNISTFDKISTDIYESIK